MEERRFIHAVYLQSLLAVSLAVLLIQACSCINNICVGKLIGADGLAVMSVVSPVGFVFATVGSLFGVGGSIYGARLIGGGDPDGANRSLLLSLTVMAGLSVILTGCMMLFIDPLLGLLKVPEAIYGDARAYLLAFAPSSFAAMGVYIPFNFLKIKGAQKYGVYLNGILFAVNIGLDILLVKVFSMGMAGIGLATTLGYWACTGLGLIFLYSKKVGFRRPEKKATKHEFASLVTLGSPSAVNNLCHLFRSFFLNLIIIASLGKSGLSAFGILSTVFLFSVTVSNGTSLSMASFSAVFSSEKDVKSLRQVFAIAMVSAGVLMGAYVVLVELFPKEICALFGTTEPEVVSATVNALRIYGISLLGSAVNTILSTYYQSIGRAILANTLTVLRNFALVVIFALVFSKVLGGETLWYGFIAAEVLTFALTLLFSKILSKTASKKLSPLLLIDLGVEESGKYLAFSVDADNAHAAEYARNVTDFCEQNELSPKLTMAIGLSVEEILVSFNDHALKEMKKTLRTNVRILIYQDIIVLRFRVPGKPFDPLGYAESDSELLSDSMGIKMVQKLSEAVLYDRVFGVNNLTIIF